MYVIQKRTPATNYYTIHSNLTEESAKHMLAVIYRNYAKDAENMEEPSLAEDGMSLYAYEGGDTIHFIVVEV